MHIADAAEGFSAVHAHVTCCSAGPVGEAYRESPYSGQPSAASCTLICNSLVLFSSYKYPVFVQKGAL